MLVFKIQGEAFSKTARNNIRPIFFCESINLNIHIDPHRPYDVM